jgi:cyclophilin family peptidyl-prolyl cis-trans isomerase
LATNVKAQVDEAQKTIDFATKNYTVEFDTTKGPIRVTFLPEVAPGHAKNFIALAKIGFYDNLIFHRVIKGFMIQGGGFDERLAQKGATHPAIKNEAGNGLLNKTGTLAMARTFVVDSATDQFFINAKDNAFLDHKSDAPQGFGYAVFGRVIKGLDVLKKIESVPTGTKPSGDGVPLSDVPVEAVVIKSIRLSR